MAKPSVEKFFDLLERSGLVDPDRPAPILRQLKAKATAGSSDTPSTHFARRLVDAGVITAWQSKKLLEGRHKGFFLGKYKLLEHLQAGGMSNVYLAEHTLMRRQVALKVLPKNRVNDTSYLERFHREAEAVASLNHENIVKAYDVDHEGMNYYLVMEYVEGRDLQITVNQDGPLEYFQAADYIRQAALGLAHAHASGLIHRDMKPANLLVDPHGVVKVLDMGLARFTNEERASLTMAYNENVLGTADYLAPEQAVDSHGVDARADIYGLGCSLYFMLTGHPPFPDGSLAQRLMMHQKESPRSISKDRPDAPQGLVGICTTMMAKKPDDRYQSAAEVVQALDDWLGAYWPPDGSGPETARPTAGGGSSGRLKRAGALEVDEEIPEVIPIADEDQPADLGLRVEARRTSDTDIQSGEPTVEASLQSGSGRLAADDLPSVETPLPIAQPVEDESEPTDFLPRAESPAVFRIRAQAQLTPEDVQSRRQGEKPLPIWVWGVLGGCCLLTVVLSLILVFGR